MQAAVMEDSAVVIDNINSSLEAAAPVELYEDLFPALPVSGPSVASSMAPKKTIRVESSLVTQVFRVPYEERRVDSEKFGEGESIRTCQSIMKDTGAHIEISSGKDKSLTFLVTGKTSEVLDARRKILVHYQTQASKQINIPKEHHRWILGKKGERLRDIEKNTATKINVPNIAEDSDIITILGTKEGIEKAEHEIRTTSDEQSKKAVERVNVPKMYHPFVLGPFSEQLNRMVEQTGARINVPPPSVMQDIIVITGEKEGVLRAKAFIEEIYREMEKKCSTVCVEVPKQQHRYVIGKRGDTLQEILQLTGVAVEMPSADSNKDTITLRGPQEKLGNALSVVYEKANSVSSVTIDAPAWIHKYIIGRKGVNINKLSAEFPDVHVEFIENKIKIEGPPEQVDKARATLETIVKDYVDTYAFVDMTVNPIHYKHIIGKAGANINRLKEDLGVTINIEEKEAANRIRIEGPTDGVRRAAEELREQIEKLENEKEKDVIIDHLLFSSLIGSKGDNIREIREKYRSVQITFPNPNEKSDIVKLRGPKEDVDKCHKQLTKMVKEIQESSYVMEVPIFKQFHKFIIGKGGVNIKKIRDETQTKIELPAEGDKNEVIVISGKKEKVNEARELILKIQSELDGIISEEITIPPKYYNSIIGAGGKLISSIMEECGGVSIKFPSPESKSDKVTIRGPKDDVEKAKAQLLELSNERQLSSFTAEVRAKPQHHKFLIGKNGASIKKIRDLTGARIVFPQSNDEDKEVITIIGKEEGVLAAKQQLELIIKDIDNHTEGEVTVDPKHHKHFVARRGRVLQTISDDFGGVTISFPRPGVESDRVTLKGSKECIEHAKQRILEIVVDLDSQVTIDCIINQKHHRTLMGSRGAKVQAITSQYNVQIKFPERNAPDEYQPEMNGDGTVGEDGTIAGTNNENGDAIRQCDVIRITGNVDRCNEAHQALLSLIPVTEEINVPFDLHRSIIGQKGRDVRELMTNYDVHIELSPQDQQLDIIKITGAPQNIQDAKLAIEERVKQLELDRKDRELRSFELQFEVDPEWHPKIIGRRGAVINKIRADHNVQIIFPRKEDDVDNIIKVQGYEEAAHAAKADILKIVEELNDLVKETVEIDYRVHARIIGQRGRGIRKIMDDFKVEIKFPRDNERDENPNLVTIIGALDPVSDAKDHLLNMEEEYLQDVVDMAPAPHGGNDFSSVLETAFRSTGGADGGDHGGHGGGGGRHGGGKKEGFVVQGAPWEKKNKKAPNTASQEDFPDFGLPTVVRETPITSAWGQRR